MMSRSNRSVRNRVMTTSKAEVETVPRPLLLGCGRQVPFCGWGVRGSGVRLQDAAVVFGV